MSPGMAKTASGTDGILEPGACDMRLVQRDADAFYAPGILAELVLLQRVRETVEDVARQRLGGRELALELRQRVEVLVVQLAQHFLEHFMRAADIDHDRMLAERLAEEGDIDHEG